MRLEPISEERPAIWEHAETIVFNSGSKCKSPLWTWLQFQKQETEIQDTQVRATHPTERTVSSLNRHIGTLSNVNHNCHLDCHGQLEINEIGTRK